MESEVLKETNGLTRVHEVLNTPDVSVPASTLHFYKSKLIIKVNLKFQVQNMLEVPKFKTALEYCDKFTFGHEKIDSVLELHLDDIVGIFGETRFSNALTTRLVVRSLLPHNHGGVDAETVIVIDADNSSSPYLYVDFARQYGMHYKSVLHKVILSRQFTIYQLTHTIIYDLPKRVQLHKPKVVVISGLLDQFYQDPHINIAEAESLISQIVTAIMIYFTF